MPDKNKHIAILGAGESGIGAALLAAQKGYGVFVSDNGTIKRKYKEILKKNNIPFEEGKHTYSKIINAKEIIVSPGIDPKNHEILQEAKNQNISIISEIEFAFRHIASNARIAAITGSNGKTTTATILHKIFENANLNTSLCGNIGRSFSASVAENNADVYVLEVSSFQLDNIVNFKPDLAIITNITPDHLDRYGEFSKYVESKFRITQNQTSSDVLVYNADDKESSSLILKTTLQPNTIPFSIKQNLEYGCYIENESIIINTNNKEELMTIQNLALQGKHNLYNSMAAAVAARIFDVRKENIKESLSNIHSIEHRLEAVLNIHGIEFINDSKATNVNSTWYALECMTKPVVWIAGGVDKGNDYSMLKGLVKAKVKAIVCLGIDNKNIIEAFKDDVETIIETFTMQQAVQYAYKLGKKEDVVLLSPACASFDLFTDFEDRGNRFKLEVRNL